MLLVVGSVQENAEAGFLRLGNSRLMRTTKFVRSIALLEAAKQPGPSYHFSVDIRMTALR